MLTRERAEALRQDVYDGMLATRKGKYGLFIIGLRSAKYLTDPIKAEILESVYCALRTVDDIVDGDEFLPLAYRDRESYVRERLKVIHGLSEPSRPEDDLLVYSRELGRQIGLDLVPEMADLLGSMKFDAARSEKNVIFSEQELDEHFFRLDIRGTIKGAFKLLGVDEHMYERVEPLGRASRIYYNIRDLGEDLNARLINISREDIERLSIDDISQDPAIKRWCVEQSIKGMELLDDYRHRMRGQSLPLAARLALPLMYAIPAEIRFHRHL